MKKRKEAHRELSKFLSYVLRHAPEAIGITLDREGWIRVDELIAAMERDGRHRGVTAEMLQEVTDTDSKGRYALRDGRMRANQGHSIEVQAVDLKPVTPPPKLYHGTTRERWPQIQSSGGLKKIKRHHVHMTDQKATAVSVGSRHRGESVLLLSIDSPRMLADGHLFYRSENGVWLTDEVPLEYLQVEDRD